MEQWKSAMTGGSQVRQGVRQAVSRMANPYQKFVTDYVMLCDMGQVDLDLLHDALAKYGATGEDKVSVESASFVAHWLIPILYLAALDEDGFLGFLREVIDMEKSLNQATPEQLNRVRVKTASRMLKHTRHMLAGCTVFSYGAMQSFVDIVMQNKSALIGSKLCRMAESISAGRSPKQRVEIGAVLSEAPYLIRALNYDLTFYENLTVRLGQAQQKYGFKPV